MSGTGSIAYDPAPASGLSTREERVVMESMMEFSQMQAWRNVTASMWEEIAELIDPPSRNTFFFGSFNWPGQKKTDRQVDASGMLALERFKAIVDSLLTPRNSIWTALGSEDDYLMKQRGVRLWFEQVNAILFKLRYNMRANFSSQNTNYFKQLGAYGTGVMWAEELSDFVEQFGPGPRYRCVPIGEMFLRENHQQMIDGGIRWFRLNPHQALAAFGKEWMDKSPGIQAALAMKSEQPWDFIHRVVPNDEYDPGRLDRKGKRFSSFIISLQGRCLVKPESGYFRLPFYAGRYEQTPGEINGRGPASYVLPALKTLNAQKTTYLKAGHRVVDPVLLTRDDGVLDMNMRPGALNKGGVGPKGELLVHPLPVGNIAYNEKMMDMERALINDAFLVALFQILMETPQMTATEVVERTNEKGILLAPTIGRQQDEYVGPMVARDMDIAARLRLIPPPPRVLIESGAHYHVMSTSPLARAARSQEAAGFMRTLETAITVANATQDASVLDPFDFDTAIPGIATIQGVPEMWMADPNKIAAKRQARAQSEQRRQAVMEAPAQAALLKAHAATVKAGMNPGNTPQPSQPPVQDMKGGMGGNMQPVGGGLGQQA